MSRRFVISDIHGCAQTFRTLVLDKIQPKMDDQLFLLGDYIDHGPDSKGVLDFIFELKEKGLSVICLKGNHEHLLLRSIKKAKSHARWIKKGGDKALTSFGVQAATLIPQKYLSFLASLPYYIELDDFFLVHAGFDFTAINPFAISKKMLTIREFEIDPSLIGDKKVIHGHVPKKLGAIKRRISDPFCQNIFLDGGCIYVQKKKLGNLLALELNSMKLYAQQCLDVILPPATEHQSVDNLVLTAAVK